LSISFSFKNQLFSLDKMELPSRYYYFNDTENYIKLLTIGEGIFPKDKIRTKICLENSSCIVSTESATKLYPSKKEYGINYINISLNNSNCEFINDELILFENAKLLQFLNINMDEKSTLFYVDILSSGRSYEHFDFTSIYTRNRFYINKKLEYYEVYEMSGDKYKEYLNRNNSKKNIFVKIYIKVENNEYFLDILTQEKFDTFAYTKSKKMIIAVISETNMADLKMKINIIWKMYRRVLNKKEFNLGKQ